MSLLSHAYKSSSRCSVGPTGASGTIGLSGLRPGDHRGSGDPAWQQQFFGSKAVCYESMQPGIVRCTRLCGPFTTQQLYGIHYRIEAVEEISGMDVAKPCIQNLRGEYVNSIASEVTQMVVVVRPQLPTRRDSGNKHPGARKCRSNLAEEADRLGKML